MGQKIYQTFVTECCVGFRHAICKDNIDLGKATVQLLAPEGQALLVNANGAGNDRHGGHGSAKNGVNGVVERGADIGVVGDGTHQRHAASVQWVDVGPDQGRRVHQQTGGNAFVKPVAF